MTCVKTAGLYARISRDRTGAGLGVERQEEDCRELAGRLGWNVTTVYVDNDISAYSSKKRRPQYELMLEDIRAGRINGVISWHVDRLTRQTKELETLIDLANAHQVEFATVRSGDLDLSTAAGRMVARILGATARHESEQKAERNRRVALQSAIAGRPAGGLRPYGYENDRLTVRADEAEVLRECARRLLAGESLRSVTSDLNARKVPTVTGALWSPTVLRAGLIRPRLIGLRTHQGKQIGDAQWPAILTVETHHALVALFTDPQRRTSSASRERVHLLTGLLSCGECGTRLTLLSGATSRPSTSRQSYGCSSCRKVSVSVLAMDRFVEGHVIGRLRSSGGLAVTEGGDDLVSDEIAAVRQRMTIASDQFADGAIPPDQLKRIQARLQRRLDELTGQLATGGHQRVLVGLFGENAQKEWDAPMPLSRKRAVIDALLEDIRVDRAGVSRRTFDPGRVTLTWR